MPSAWDIKQTLRQYKKVDLVSKKALKPAIGRRILAEVVQI